MSSQRIVYMGTPDFAVYPLKRLLESGHNIVGVVTNPDKPAGRGRKIRLSPIKEFALKHRLPLLQPERFRDPEFLEELKLWRADLQIVVAFKMLPEVVWSMPPLGTVNLHASLLPDYRGAAPINWAIINGERETGVTTFFLSHEIDTGDIIRRKKVDISEKMSAGELHDSLMHVGAEVLLETVDDIFSGTFLQHKQMIMLEGREPKQAPKIFKDQMQIDWSEDLHNIYNHIRGLSPFPTAWTLLRHIEREEELSLKIYAASYSSFEHHREIGTIETDGGKQFDVYVSGGVIEIKELQLAGKRRMGVEEFLRGFRLDEYRVVLY